MSPDLENKEDPGAEAKDKAYSSKPDFGLAKREKRMELAIAIATAATVICWIGIGIAIYLSSRSGVIWWTYASIMFAILVPFLVWQKRVWEKPRTGTAITGAAIDRRPRVFVEKVTARKLVAGHEQAVVLELKNRGTETAHRITAWINQGLVDAQFPGPLEFAPLVEPETRPDCPPGGVISLAGLSSKQISQAQIIALNTRKTLWFHFGKGTYEDESGSNTYSFDFCYMYQPEIGNMAICPDRYWPKPDRPSPVTKRPEISLEYVEARCVPGKPPKVSILIKNRGQITAHRIELEPTDYFAHARTFKGPIEHVPKVPPYMYPKLAVGAEAAGDTEGGEPLTIQDVADIESGKLLFLHYSKGHYEDDARNVYPLEFCFMYVPGGQPNMRIAPKAFWPKKEG